MLPDLPSLNTYGGVLQNTASVENPETDEDAKYRNRYVTDVAAMARTACRAIVSFFGVNGANPSDPASGFVHDALWGSSAPYKPVATRNTEGVYDITFVTEVDDALTAEPAALGGGETHTISFRRAFAQVQCSDGTLRHVAAEVTGANVVRVRGWTAAGALDDLPGQVITVWIW